MEYLALFNEAFEKVDKEDKGCCLNPDIQHRDFTMLCVNCGVVQQQCEEENPYIPNSIKENVFYPSLSSATTMSYSHKHKSLQRLDKWSSYSSKDAEANKCYGIITDMMLNVIPNLKEDNCLGERILHKAKLYWKALYYDILKKSTRGERRKCLFGFCIIKAFEFYEVDFKILEILKNMNVDIKKYNEVLKLRINNDEDKVYVNKQFSKFLKIINQHNPFITLEILVERYNINKKNKIAKSKLPKGQRIGVNDSSLLKAIAYDFIKDDITKQEACDDDVLDISSLTLNKALKLII